ncbi:hypothetical protein [Aurantibacter aestuarii]|uniref:DUF3185 domain-containing protein n=1 Tax=Aurantibacter aestuarii TaxID=1266046 RepID=A0A2T1NBE5_9FLAO|nr:hypothetical protein [Aurantibacter aestuarii]PSG89471.1 hypothetical protein C7H52_06765 [Aurantibacter aestuarii]
MNNLVSIVLRVVGLILLGYGIYQVIMPEASVDLGVVKAIAQDNSDAYVTMGLGLLSIGLGYFIGRKK